MSSLRSPLSFALCQPLMSWEGDENTANACRALALAAEAGAALCVFPELMITGFHRRIGEMARPERVAGWLGAVQDACATHRIATSIGAPTFGDDGKIYNSQLFIDATGQLLGAVDKEGLTDPEATFFARGTGRPTFPLADWRVGTIICREIEDKQTVWLEVIAGQPDVILWPGALRPDPLKPRTIPFAHIQDAQGLARAAQALVVQINWPNALNRPEESAESGQSVVIAPDGEILLTLPPEAGGLALFTLGDRPYRWLPQEQW